MSDTYSILVKYGIYRGSHTVEAEEIVALPSNTTLEQLVSLLKDYGYDEATAIVIPKQSKKIIKENTVF